MYKQIKLNIMKTIKKIAILILILSSVSSCYKMKSFKKVKVNIKVINPVTGAPIPNLKWQIFESKKDLAVFSSNSHLFMEGFTDQNGEAYIEFKKPMGSKWGYQLSMGVSSYPESWNIDNDKVYNITAYKSGNVSLIKHIKNKNCFDVNDIAIFKVDGGIYTSNTDNSSTFTYNGCFENTYNPTILEDYYPYTLTVTRNGQTTVTRDTFKIQQGMDTLKWYY